MNAPTPATLTLALPPELTIYTAREMLPQWLGWLHQLPADADVATVDGAGLGEIDGAGVQMLVSLQRTLAERGRRMCIQAPSDALQSGCRAAGLAAWLPPARAAEETP